MKAFSRLLAIIAITFTSVLSHAQSTVTTSKLCAVENAVCTPTSYPATVVYGVNSSWSTPKTIMAPLACSNATWPDPAKGTVKACYVVTACAAENFTCMPQRYPATVIYGAGKGWSAPKTVNAPIACNNATWGDPINGSVKACYVLSYAPVVKALYWSDPNTWGGKVPTAGSDVVIPAGKTIILDQDITTNNLEVDGTLQFADKDINLTAASVHVMGTFQIGSSTQPYVNKAKITLNGQPVAVNDGASRGFVVMGGSLQLYGNPPSPTWTKINQDAQAAAVSLTLKETTNWKAGDSIVIGPTDFKGINPTERIVLSGASGNTLTLKTPLQKYRWGRLQYITASGMSLIPDPNYTPPALPAPTVLDERAIVGNLSRNIVIQGADDTAWSTKGFGGHLMVMDLTSKVVINGVEFRRMGQAGVTGRYPIHFHMLSYNGDTGALIGDASSILVKNTTVSNSSNRCMVLHGTNGITLDSNICYEVNGHSFFLENAVERRSVLNNNLALVNHNQKGANLLQIHESDVGSGGASGFWITNPDTVLTNNAAAEADGNGIWMAFPNHTLGLSAKVAMKPFTLAHALFDNNQANSNGKPGMMMQQNPCDDAGNICLDKYRPTKDEGAHEFSDYNFDASYRIQVELKHASLWKNGDGAYRNRVIKPLYTEWVTADNPSVQLAGGAEDGLIQRSLFIGYSLNSTNKLPSFNAVPVVGVATYAQRVADKDNTFVNFEFVPGRSSGMFDMEDYYLHPVITTTAFNTGNRLINTNPGYRFLPPNLWNPPSPNGAHYTLASAIWDPIGLAGPKGNYWVYDVPFLTSGQTCVPVPPAGQNQTSCQGPYYGIAVTSTQYNLDIYSFTPAEKFTRLDQDGKAFGVWEIADGRVNSNTLPNMRHAAFVKNGIYTVEFPNYPLPTQISLLVSNAYRTDDAFLLGISFDGTRTVSNGYMAAGAVNGPYTAANWSDGWLLKGKRTFHYVDSLDKVKSGDGTAMYQDKAKNLVWIKFLGGLPQVQPPAAGSADDLDRNQIIVLIGN